MMSILTHPPLFCPPVKWVNYPSRLPENVTKNRPRLTASPPMSIRFRFQTVLPNGGLPGVNSVETLSV